MFVDVALANDEDISRALAVLEDVSAQMRSDDTWRAALVDGPRVLGVESLSLAGVALRLQLRTAPTRQHEVARELRRRIRARFEQERIGVSAVDPVALAGSEKS
jgi:small-conductance mechanosensitive channel